MTGGRGGLTSRHFPVGFLDLDFALLLKSSLCRHGFLELCRMAIVWRQEAST